MKSLEFARKFILNDPDWIGSKVLNPSFARQITILLLTRKLAPTLKEMLSCKASNLERSFLYFELLTET